jgi:hypothetical protein
MIKADKSDGAWAAGFFEGEGSISVSRLSIKKRRRSPEYRLGVRIVNTDPRPLCRLQRLFGGHIYAHEPKTKPRCSRAFTWQLTMAAEQVRFLEVILPYLCFKQEQVNIAMAIRKSFDETRKIGRRSELKASVIAYREELRLRLKELNRRGRPRARLELQLPIAIKTKQQNQLEFNLETGKRG